MSNQINRELDEILSVYGRKGALARWGYRFLYLYRVLLTLLANICPLTELRIVLARLKGVNLGKDVFIGYNVDFDIMFPDKIFIGDHTGIGTGTIISAHHSIPMDSPLKKVFPRSVRPVHIGRGVDCNLNVIIQPGLTIGDYALIGSGSIVTRDVPPMVMVAGVPAKVIKDLSEQIRPHISEEEFEKLIKERNEKFNWSDAN